MSQSDFVSRGQALVAAGQFQEAVKVCRLGLLGRPTTIEGRLVLGQALLALKRFDEVLAEMRVALDLDNTSIPAQVLRAEALLRKGDVAAAVETLHKIRREVPGDPRVLQLLGEAEHGGSRPSLTHPSVGFVGQGDTRHYPGYASDGGDPEPGEFTSQTSLARPTSRRAAQRPPEDEPPTKQTPVPVFEPKTGTVEVDPDLEGIEVPGEEDSLVDPPVASKDTRIGRKHAGKPMPKAIAKSTRALDADDEAEELQETGGLPLVNPRELPGGRPPGPGPATKVRNAVAMPSGVIGAFEDSGPMGAGGRPKSKTLPPPFNPPGTAPPGARTAPADVPQLFAQEGLGPRSKPATMPPPLTSARPKPPTMPPPVPDDGFGPRAKAPPSPSLAATFVPPAPLPPAPRSPIAAALPTVAAAQPPPPFVQQQAPYPPPGHASQHPTMAVPAAQGGWSPDGGMNPYVDPRSLAAAHEPTARPAELDPHILALMAGGPAEPQQMQMQMPMPMQHMREPVPQLPSHLLALDQVSLPQQQYTPQGPMRTGVRKPRSKLMLALSLLVGVLVIGGGVFAGFKIRAIRLEKKIAAARVRATDVAKADTFSGWIAARDSLASIVGASSTVANRAALARTRALIAYAFDDGVPEAKTAVEQLKGQGGLDGRLAVALAALMKGEPKAAKTATDEAVQGSDADALAQYLAGEAALLAGNLKVAVAAMKLATDKDNRPMFGVGLARAHAAAYNWDEAVVAIDRVLALTPEHPTAVIERANILAASGRIFPGSALGNEVKQQLERVIVTGKLIVSGKQAADDTHSVAPMQVAFASLALARVELSRGDLVNAKKAVRGATDVGLDDVRFAEETVSTLYALGELGLARTAAEVAQKQYPTSLRILIAYANILVAQGRANDALDALAKQADVLALPDGYVARAYAELAIGDTIGAASDFDAALKQVPTHEGAITGRAWLELASGDVEAASRRIAERMNAKGASPAVQIAYAATLRRSGDAAQREQAKQLLEKLVASPGGPELFRAQLELARIYRDAGDFAASRSAYERASKGGSIEARLESALVLIEYSKPAQGRETLDKLLEEAGDRPSAAVVIEAARARMLVGSHTDAQNLLAMADKMSSVERWKLDRERGRLALRKSDFTGAATALSRALDGCAGDAETFLLAADVATADNALAEKVKKLVPERLKGRPEAQIIAGKLALAAEKPAEAEAAYKAAKQALRAEKASNRRLAQADFGLAFVEYGKQNNAGALPLLDLVIQEDPTLVDAYMMEVEIVKDKKKAYDLAQNATRFNPDYAYAWLVVGRLASELKDKRSLADAIARLTQIAPQGDELKELQKLH